MTATAADLKPQQTGQECGPNQVLWLHFVNNQLPKDTAAGTLTLKVKTLGSGIVVFVSTGPDEVLKKVQHFRFGITSSEGLVVQAASTDLPGKLLLSDSYCGCQPPW
jgi:hypothetical protein